jgi:membrane-associated protein
VPTLAGMNRMPYRRFLAWNAAGGISWATAVVLAGYAAGSAWRTVAHYLGSAGAVLCAVLVAAALAALLVRRRRSKRRERRKGLGRSRGDRRSAQIRP